MTERPLERMRVCCSLISSFPFNNARAIKIAESLIDAGADVTVLFDSPGEPQLPEGRFRAVRVEWEQITPSTSPFRLVRAIHDRVVLPPMRWLLENLRRYGLDMKLIAAMVRADADVYHAYVLNSAIPAYVASRIRRAKIVFDVRDFFCDSRRAILTPRQASYYRWMDRRLYRRADLVLGISQPMVDAILAENPTSRAEVLYNGAWQCTPTPPPAHRPVRLFFQGYFQADRNLQALVGAMQHLRGRATLTLQGWGGIEAELRQQIEDMGLQEDVFFLEACDPIDVIACGRNHDVGIVCHQALTLNHRIAVPNKLMDYLGAGLALAGSDLPGIRSIVDTYHCGVLLDPTDSETLAGTLEPLIDDPDGITRMKAAAARACEDLCWDRQAEHLVAWYQGFREHRERTHGHN